MYEKKEVKPEELIEICMYYDCERKFTSYLSMMRHVALKHRPDKTLSLMRQKPWDEVPLDQKDLKIKDEFKLDPEEGKPEAVAAK